MEPRFIFLQLSATWPSSSARICLFSRMSPAPVKFAILNCVELIFTTCLKMLSGHRPLLLSCPESITAILYSLAVLSNSLMNFKKFRTTLQGSSVELLSLIIYLPSFTLFTGFLLNKELNTNCFSFKFVNNEGPSYLSDLLKFYIPSRQLRSSSDIPLLRIPSFRLKFF